MKLNRIGFKKQSENEIWTTQFQQLPFLTRPVMQGGLFFNKAPTVNFKVKKYSSNPITIHKHF